MVTPVPEMRIRITKPYEDPSGLLFYKGEVLLVAKQDIPADRVVTVEFKAAGRYADIPSTHFEVVAG